MKTFKERFCEEHRCAESDFQRRIFWRCLHRHAVVLAPLAALTTPDYFAPERELIEFAGRVRTMRQLDTEIRGFMSDHRNRHWWRQRVHVRISTQRHRRLARGYLTANTAERPVTAAG